MKTHNTMVVIMSLLLLIVRPSLADDYIWKTPKYGYDWKIIVLSCNDVSMYYNFSFGSSAFNPYSPTYYTRMCIYPPSAGTILNCISNSYPENSSYYKKALDYMVIQCNSFMPMNVTADTLSQLYENSTKYVVDFSLLEKNGINSTTATFNYPLNITREMVSDEVKYMKSYYYNIDMPQMFSGLLYCFFLFVFLLHALSKFFKRLGIHKRLHGILINQVRSHLTIPALFNGKHSEAIIYANVFSALTPTRMESVVVILFIALNILLISVHYDYSSPVDTRIDQIQEFLAYRTGILAFGHVPLIVLLAGRNNLISGITGIPQSTLLLYHKVVARMMTLCALIHSASFTSDYLRKGTYYEEFNYVYLRWGVTALTLAFLILFQSLHYFRRVMYDIFITIHIIFVVLFMVACFYHCIELGNMEWMYASWALWISERLIRLIRVVSFGFSKAQFQLISDDTFKVRIKHKKTFKPFPGAYGFLYIITPTALAQSHPFTIISSSVDADEILFHIKTKTGMTNRINKMLLKLPDNKKEITASVEGPYGSRAPLEQYQTVLLITGGNGIPGPYYHAMNLTNRQTSDHQNIKLLWAIRKADAVCWFYEELIALAKKRKVQIEVYVTGDCEIPDSVKEVSDDEKSHSQAEEVVQSDSHSEHEKMTNGVGKTVINLDMIRDKRDYRQVIKLLSSYDIRFFNCRPNVEQLISTEFTAGPNSVAVMTCGPPVLCDHTRKYVAKYLPLSKGRVDLFDELQVW